MIFVTVGAQMPFDRLVSAVDGWAGRRRRTDVFAQIGPSSLEPRHLRWVRFVGPDDFRKEVAGATVVVAHAGMGTILTALEYGKPLIVMPRRGDLQETRNDHQGATAERFAALGRVHVAIDAARLSECLDRVADLPSNDVIQPYASEELLRALRAFVNAPGNRR